METCAFTWGAEANRKWISMGDWRIAVVIIFCTTIVGLSIGIYLVKKNIKKLGKERFQEIRNYNLRLWKYYKKKGIKKSSIINIMLPAIMLIVWGILSIDIFHLGFIGVQGALIIAVIMLILIHHHIKKYSGYFSRTKSIECNISGKKTVRQMLKIIKISIVAFAIIEFSILSYYIF